MPAIVRHTTPAIIAARQIVKGDVSAARDSLRGHRWPGAFRACEARAIIGACRAANARYGCNLDFRSFLGW